MKQSKQAPAKPRALDARALASATGGATTPQPWLPARLDNPEPSPW